MKPLTGDEYNNVFDVTGIDVDGRREMLQKFFLPNMEACIKRFVNFVKAIPGFTQLPLCDQITLVKGILVSTSSYVIPCCRGCQVTFRFLSFCSILVSHSLCDFSLTGSCFAFYQVKLIQLPTSWLSEVIV